MIILETGHIPFAEDPEGFSENIDPIFERNYTKNKLKKIREKYFLFKEFYINEKFFNCNSNHFNYTNYYPT